MSTSIRNVVVFMPSRGDFNGGSPRIYAGERTLCDNAALWRRAPEAETETCDVLLPHLLKAPASTNFLNIST